jgi:hypothetical protein
MNNVTLMSVVSLYACGAVTAAAAPIAWTDWTTATNGTLGTASGVISYNGAPLIKVSYSGEVAFAQLAGGTNYWDPAKPFTNEIVSNAPPAADIVALIGGSNYSSVLTFSSPVTDPIMAIVGLGRPSQARSYDFDQPFDVLSFAPGFLGGPGKLVELPGSVLEGREGHGTIQFKGTFSSIRWTVPIAENWHGFTVGAVNLALADEPETVTPEPDTLALALFGSLAIAIGRWRTARRT